MLTLELTDKSVIPVNTANNESIGGNDKDRFTKPNSPATSDLISLVSPTAHYNMVYQLHSPKDENE